MSDERKRAGGSVWLDGLLYDQELVTETLLAGDSAGNGPVTPHSGGDITPSE